MSADRTSAASPQQRVLYVAGWGRSGSTLLSRLLSVHDRVVYVGELRDLWVRGVAENRTCGCGDRFHDCTFWRAVGQEAYGGWETQDPAIMIALQHVADRPWTGPALKLPSLPGPRGEAVDAYVGMLRRVLRAIDVVTEGRIVLDASKIPSYGLLLERTGVVDLRVVHLVRDPRGVVYSWQKAVASHASQVQEGLQPDYMPQYSPSTAVLRYNLYNGQTGLLAEVAPFLRIRYEDLVAEPRRTLQQVAAHAGIDDLPLGHVAPEGDHHLVTMGPSHSVVGNPMRMRTGAQPLRRDDAWRTGLDAMTTRLVTAGTYPLLRAYGYAGAR